MTQMLTPADILPMTAMVIQHHALGVTRLHYLPMVSVEAARDEFGGTPADALRFIEGVMCTECGTEATETRDSAIFQLVCRGCGTTACRCVLAEDAHDGDTFWCGDCQPYCGCRYCSDD